MPTTGYSAKLLLMFSAIESLSRTRDKTVFAKSADLSKKILGDSLWKEIFEPENGLRNRLSHGEYWDPADNTNDYVEEVHKKVISYINNEIIGSVLIDENVVQPQRNFFENKGAWGPGFIKEQIPNSLSLVNAMSHFDKKTEDKFFLIIGHGEEYEKLKNQF